MYVDGRGEERLELERSLPGTCSEHGNWKVKRGPD